jgi:flagellar hook assembly protein FlgD
MVNYPAVLQIFDIRGRLVRTLVNTIRQPGRFAVQWEGKADNGKTIASGLFIYKFQAGNFVSKKKMIMLK